MATKRRTSGEIWVCRFQKYIDVMMTHVGAFSWQEWLEAAVLLKSAPLTKYRKLESDALEFAFLGLESEEKKNGYLVGDWIDRSCYRNEST